MRPPVRSTFYKLWGKIDQDLDKGTYRVTIQNGMYYYYILDVRLSSFNIEKSLVLQNTNWLGGYNPWLYYSYFMSALIFFFAGGSLMYIRKLEDAETTS